MYRKTGAQPAAGSKKREFTVWAPHALRMELELAGPGSVRYELEQQDFGYWSVQLEEADAGRRYFYHINGELRRPDPASLCQPEGVHGPSEIVDLQQFSWTDQQWKGLPASELIIYELHTSTFTPQGTFEGVIKKLDYLSELGVNAIEIMPVGQFPGSRNWGYDGVFPFAVQHSYGGPYGLQKLVNACHEKGMAVVLDVIYNHLGPEGNYLGDYGPYFTEKYHTPWGKALNFDDAWCHGVRNYFLQNALMWFRDFHIDVLRLDAVHAIKDLGARHFLAELSESVQQFSAESGRQCLLLAECDLNDPRFLEPVERNGLGMQMQWVDEFHHALHSLLTHERNGYYQDFGEMEHLARAFERGYVYTGEWSPHRQKYFGQPLNTQGGEQLVVFTQNHDQVGNRMLGDRLSKLVCFKALKLAATAMFTSPFVPMLFMGEEYGETNPFLYFVSHTDPELCRLVRQGRKREFAEFHKDGEAPDADAEETFLRSRLQWDHRLPQQQALLKLYRYLIKLKKEHPVLRTHDRQGLKASVPDSTRLLMVLRQKNSRKTCVLLNFANETATIAFNPEEGTASVARWKKIFDSADEKWHGSGESAPGILEAGSPLIVQPLSAVIYDAADS